MPEISRFLGITIFMYFNEHNPPHFHVKYEKHRASIAIETLAIMDGSLPPRVYSLVVEWASSNKIKLLNNWNSIKEQGTFNKIKPLT